MMKKQWAIGLVMLLVFVATVMAADMTFNATQYHNTTGAITEGQLNSTYWIDADVINISEVVNAPGFDFRFNFTGMAVSNEGYVRFDLNTQYEGNPSHVVYYQLYNRSSLTWDTLGRLTEGGFLNYSYTVTANDSKSAGIIMTRLYHASAGDINHYQSVNLISATEVETLPEEPVEEEFETGSCPTDTLPRTILFIFFGILLVVGFLYCDSKGIGLGLIVVGILTIFYSLPLYGCSIAWGLILTFAGLFIGLYAWKLKYY